MGTIFERVTYYDLYGYTIPGCLLVILCFWKDFLQWIPDLRGFPKEAYLYVFLIFVFLGMVIGIIMSEITDFIFGMLYQYGYKMHLSESSLGISYKVIKRALLKAGVAEDPVSIKNPEDVCNWLWYIYASVQADKAYNRLHNYASSQLMYGNLAIAIGVGGIVTAVRLSLHIGPAFLVIGGSMTVAALLLIRTRRFGEKKEVYAIYWFIEKYLDTQPAKTRAAELAEK